MLPAALDSCQQTSGTVTSWVEGHQGLCQEGAKVAVDGPSSVWGWNDPSPGRRPGRECRVRDQVADRSAWDRVVDPAGAAAVAGGAALSWLSCYRRLALQWDRSSERFFAFVLLACALACFNRLSREERYESLLGS
jgi:hypothetical protein